MAPAKLQPLHPGERTRPEGKPIRNIISAVRTRRRIPIDPSPLEISRYLPHHVTLHLPHRMAKFLYFPNEGLISLVIEMKHGKAVEAGLLGNDGAAGIPGVFGLSRSPLLEIVRVGGNGFRIKVADFRAILKAAPQLRTILNRYAAGLATQVAKTAACSRLHNVEKRLARWLLIAQDRVDSGLIPITHDFLATMLGTDRPTAKPRGCRFAEEGNY